MSAYIKTIDLPLELKTVIRPGPREFKLTIAVEVVPLYGPNRGPKYVKLRGEGFYAEAFYGVHAAREWSPYLGTWWARLGKDDSLMLLENLNPKAPEESSDDERA